MFRIIILLVSASVCFADYFIVEDKTIDGPRSDILFSLTDPAFYIADEEKTCIYEFHPNLFPFGNYKKVVYNVPAEYGFPYNVLAPGLSCGTYLYPIFIATAVNHGVLGPAKILVLNPKTYQLIKVIGGTELKVPLGMVLGYDSITQGWSNVIVADGGSPPSIHVYNWFTGEYKRDFTQYPNYAAGIQDLKWNGCTNSELFVLCGKNMIKLYPGGTFRNQVFYDEEFSHAWSFVINFVKQYFYCIDMNRNMIRQYSMDGTFIRNIQHNLGDYRSYMVQPMNAVVMDSGDLLVTSLGKIFRFSDEGVFKGYYSEGDWGRPTGIWQRYMQSMVEGDFNQDKRVNSADAEIMSSCCSGPNVPYDYMRCSPEIDMDGDGDIDQIDFGLLQVKMGD